VEYGFNRCEVRVDTSDGGDAFPADDGSAFVVRRADPERVLFVHASGDTRSPLYFGAALDAAAQGSYILQSVAAEQTTDLDPSRFAFVVLSDAAALPSIFVHTMEQYVAKGGNVLIALGTGVSIHGQIPLWGGNVTGIRNYGGDAATVASVDFNHPAFEQPVPGRANGGWGETKVFYAATVDAGSARVAARLSDGTPFLIDRQVGEGHLLLLTSGLENLTNDLPLHPVFVTFVDHLARYLAGSERLSGARQVDSFVQLRGPARPAGDATSVEVIDPDGRRPLSLSEARTVQSFQFRRAGFYQIRFANGRDAVIGVNPDRRESDLAPIPYDIQQLWSGSSGTNAAPISATEARYRPVSLWWYVMLLALAAVLAQIFLASGYMSTQREEL
jgi:hypothetical protein